MSPTARRTALLALAVLAADQLTKALARSFVDPGETVELLAGIDLVNVENDGVAFGLFGGSTAIVLIITVLAGAGLLYYLISQPTRPGQAVAVGLLAGGAIGNVIDRIAAGEVTDFIDFPGWPAFNLADVGITVGIATLIVTELLAEFRARS